MTIITDGDRVEDEHPSPGDDSGAAWRNRRWLARAARLVIVGVPFGVVIVVAWQINAALGTPASVLEAVARWATLSVVSTLVLVGIDRSARQLLPLTALLQLAIVFPDQAPSRFRIALRQGTAKHLARDVAELENATAQQAAEYMLTIVGQLTAHDRLTRGHTERVRAYSDLVAAEMGLTTDERTKLQWAGLLHDIGKLTVPSDVLNKSHKLSNREWSRLKSHPSEGWKMVQPMRGWLGEWARGTRDHHERWDGGGYPRGIKGTEISRAGRIIAVADAFDVMTSVRAYKTAMSHEHARAELAKCAGTQFDPDVVRAFLSASFTPERRGKVGAWLANSPIALQATSIAQLPAVATSAIVAAIAATSILIPAFHAAPSQEAAERVVAETVATTPAPPTTRPRTTTAPRTSTTTTTTTAASAPVPPATTGAAPAATSPPPTTTPSPTTTNATIVEVPPSTTLPPSTFAGGFLGAGPGGSTFGLVSTTSGSGAINWDSDNNADPGLTLTSGAGGLAEIDAPHVEAWSIVIADETLLQGQASLVLYVATPNFRTESLGGIRAGLVDCVNPTTNCTTIGSGSAVFSQDGFGGDFGAITLSLGAINHTLAPGHSLLVTMAAPQNLATGTWLAFGTSTYPSRFRVV